MHGRQLHAPQMQLSLAWTQLRLSLPQQRSQGPRLVLCVGHHKCDELPCRVHFLAAEHLLVLALVA